MLFGLEIGGVLSLHFTTVAAVLFAVAAILMIAFSLRDPAGATESPGADPPLLVRGALALDAGEAVPGRWRDYRLLSVLLILLTAGVVLAFW